LFTLWGDTFSVLGGGFRPSWWPDVLIAGLHALREAVLLAEGKSGSLMRAVVIFLVLLAATKLGCQEYLFRAATRDAIVGAYKEHAVQACQSDSKNHALGLSAQAWANPKSVALVIGKRSLDVYPWQLDHALWNARYRNPYLFLTTSERSGSVRCEYDIVNAAAAVSRM
jgi:hypothetical protein